MNAFRLFVVMVAALLCAGTAVAGGYEGVRWGSSVDEVARRYPRGQKLKLGDGELYRQSQPANHIARRMFGFSKEGLHTVTIVFDQNYVRKRTLEQIIAELTKQYGASDVDRSNAPEKLSLQWHKDDSRITLGYSPRRPDMTVMLFEKITP